MFYEIKDEIKEIGFSQIDPEVLTVGCIQSEELVDYGDALGFGEETIVESQTVNPVFRTGVDVHSDYTFAELRILNHDGEDDYVSLFAKRNLLLIVDIKDVDNSTTNAFLNSLKKYPADRICLERIVYAFIVSLLSGGNKISEEIRNKLAQKEEEIVEGTAGEKFNIELLAIKKIILKYYNFYQQILDVTETLEENDNEILDDERLIYISNLTSKVTRLSNDMDSLNNIADHLQDAYATLLDQRMNNTMKVFTIITTIFFPLTIIVGWYGMNFTHMPELTWEYGYVYVSVLSILIVLILVLIGKKKKWF